jgi:hypothetical protein
MIVTVGRAETNQRVVREQRHRGLLTGSAESNGAVVPAPTPAGLSARRFVALTSPCCHAVASHSFGARSQFRRLRFRAVVTDLLSSTGAVPESCYGPDSKVEVSRRIA